MMCQIADGQSRDATKIALARVVARQTVNCCAIDPQPHARRVHEELTAYIEALLLELARKCQALRTFTVERILKETMSNT